MVEASFRWLRSVSAVKLFCWPFAISKANCVCMSGNERQLSAVSASMKNDANGETYCYLHDSVNHWTQMTLPLLAEACLSDSRLHMKKLGCRGIRETLTLAYARRIGIKQLVYIYALGRLVDGSRYLWTCNVATLRSKLDVVEWDQSQP